MSTQTANRTKKAKRNRARMRQPKRRHGPRLRTAKQTAGPASGANAAPQRIGPRAGNPVAQSTMEFCRTVTERTAAIEMDVVREMPLQIAPRDLSFVPVDAFPEEEEYICWHSNAVEQIRRVAGHEISYRERSRSAANRVRPHEA